MEPTIFTLNITKDTPHNKKYDMDSFKEIKAGDIIFFKISSDKFTQIGRYWLPFTTEKDYLLQLSAQITVAKALLEVNKVETIKLEVIF